MNTEPLKPRRQRPESRSLLPISGLTPALKRSMAAEFSRELGVKVFEGKLALLVGFLVGGDAGHGLRRLLVSARKARFEKGQQKSVATERTVLVPGPTERGQKFL